MSVRRICCCIRQYPLADDFAYSPHLSVWQCILKLIQSRSQSLRFPTDGRYTVTVFGYQIDKASVSNWQGQGIKHSRQCLTTFPNIFEVRQKYFATRRIFNSLLGVWRCGQTLSWVVDILHQTTWRSWMLVSRRNFENGLCIRM